MNYYSQFLDRDDCFLLLVDIQKVMLDPCVAAERVKTNAAALIDVAAILEIPIIFSQHNPEKLGGFLPQLMGKVTKPRVVDKMEFSCFQNENFKKIIDGIDRKTLILTGLESHICVFHTGALAMQLGFRVHVVADAVCSRSSLNWKIGLRRLEKGGAVISSTEMVIFELLNRAGTPEFRETLPIIKAL